MMDYSYLNQTFDSGSIDPHHPHHSGQLNAPLSSCSYPELSNSYNLNQFKSYYLNQSGSLPSASVGGGHTTPGPSTVGQQLLNSAIGSPSVGSHSPINSSSINSSRNG